MPAKRLYFPSSGSSPDGVAPAFGSLWDKTSDALRYTLRSVPGGSGMGGLGSAENVATLNWDVLIRQWISVDTVLEDKTISGAVDFVMITQENNADANYTLQMRIAVYSNDGTIHRGDLLSSCAPTAPSAGNPPDEFATTSQTRILTDVELTPVDSFSGDRLVIELGYRSWNTNTNNRTGFIRPGDPTSGTPPVGVDFELTSGLTTDGRPWIEFSEDPFAADAPPSIGSAGWGIVLN